MTGQLDLFCVGVASLKGKIWPGSYTYRKNNCALDMCVLDLVYLCVNIKFVPPL